ncbi:PAS domain-containing protein [Pseudomonas sp. dw_358]|uniref:PAS domain-containing protein n=1 Tax=Pseudomonas sp. dw_358 TaxID=2720083 RepID=UPI001BD2E5D5|nr:PAS domain-containing protein [Pseudomonas sp. dw_358]
MASVEGADAWPVALVQLDDDGWVRQANRAWVRMMGQTCEQCSLAEWVHQEDRSLWQRALQEVRAREDLSFNQRLRFVHPEGGLRWLDVSLARGEAGFYLSAQDASAHKRREIALQASQRSALSLLHSMPGLIYRGRNNRDWTMEFVSAGCLALTGHPAERLTDSHDFTYAHLIHPADADYVWREVQYALARRQPYELWYRICCADGGLKDVWEKGVGIYSDTGEVLGVEGAIFEVVNLPGGGG